MTNKTAIFEIEVLGLGPNGRSRLLNVHCPRRRLQTDPISIIHCYLFVCKKSQWQNPTPPFSVSKYVIIKQLRLNRVEKGLGGSSIFLDRFPFLILS